MKWGKGKIHVFEKKNYICTGLIKFAHGKFKKLRMALQLQ